MLKKLISAETVRAAHAEGETHLWVNVREHIVTPEARVVAERLGLILADTEAPAAPDGTASVTPSGEADALREIRARVLAQLPEGSVSAELVEQLVRKAAAEHLGTAQAGPAIKCVRADEVSMGVFDGAGPGQQVRIADVITAADGSAMAAGFMQWENAFFPWTLNYDEVDLVLEGELHVRHGGRTTVARAGDVVFIPKGSSIEFGTPQRVRFLYVAYPANWQSC